MQDCFKLLHFHLGSQITNIRHIKAALNEAARVYVELVQPRRRAGISRRRRRAGRRLRRLANQLRVERQLHAAGIRQRRRLSHPKRVRRRRREASDDHFRKRPRGRGLSQRAGVQRAGRVRARARTTCRRNCPTDVEQPLLDLLDTYQNLTVRNVLESYHDAQQSLDMAMNLFTGGYLPLEQRSLAENLYLGDLPQDPAAGRSRWSSCPRSCRGSTRCSRDTYFCNFSLFQSMPDSWAIKQLFPVMPIHRLNERPTRHAVLGDITCDSDGKIDQFIDRRDVKRTLAAAPVQRRAVLPGRVPARRLSGNPGRPAQPVRRHQRRARQPWTTTAKSCSKPSSRATRSARCSTTSSSTPTLWSASCDDSVEVAVREGRIGYEEAGRFLKFYEEGLRLHVLEEPDRNEVHHHQPLPRIIRKRISS